MCVLFSSVIFFKEGEIVFDDRGVVKGEEFLL